jgi:hypothetical protein
VPLLKTSKAKDDVKGGEERCDEGSAPDETHDDLAD